MFQDDGELEDRFQIFNKFIDALKQQQLCPELLPYEKQLVDFLKKETNDQKSRIQQYITKQPEQEVKIFEKNFKYLIYNSEVDKMTYLLKSYLKMRLKKIQLYAFYLTKNHKIAEAVLSTEELIFLKRYAEQRFRYYDQNALKYLPKQYRGMGGIEHIFGKSGEEKLLVQSKQSQLSLMQPPLEEFAYAKILMNPEEIRYNFHIPVANISSESTMVAMNDIIYAPYSQIKSNFKPGQYKLL